MSIKSKGIVLLEVLVVIGVIGILAGIIFIAVNPNQQRAKMRDLQRKDHLNSIATAIYKFDNDHNNILPGDDDSKLNTDFPVSETCIGTKPPCFNLAIAGVVDGKNDSIKDNMVPKYLPNVPKDPWSGTDDDTGYKIYYDAETSKLVLTATGELTDTITVTY